MWIKWFIFELKMSCDVILYCELLKSVIGSQDNKKASANLDAIDQYFNDRISENEIGEFFISLTMNDFNWHLMIEFRMKKNLVFVWAIENRHL